MRRPSVHTFELSASLASTIPLVLWPAARPVVATTVSRAWHGSLATLSGDLAPATMVTRGVTSSPRAFGDEALPAAAARSPTHLRQPRASSMLTGLSQLYRYHAQAVAVLRKCASAALSVAGARRRQGASSRSRARAVARRLTRRSGRWCWLHSCQTADGGV